MAKQSHRHTIVFLLNSFGIGGIERQLLAQLKHYSRDKYDLHLIVLYNYEDRPTLYDELPPDVTVHRFHCLYGKLNLLELWQVAKLLKQLKPRLVISSMFGPNAFNRFCSVFLGYTPLPREHNTYADLGWPQRVIEHLFSYLSPTVVAVSNEVADFTARQSWLPRRKYTVIQNGVDLEQLAKQRTKTVAHTAQLRREFDVSDTSRVWLNVARLKPQKNLDLLIDSFAVYSKTYPADHLFILGDGHEYNRLVAKVEALGLSERIHLTGYRSDVLTFYELADYFILTSDIEGFPNVVLEAMAFSLPVLSTAVAGIDEIVVDGKNGFVLERSIEAVRATMSNVRDCSDERYQALCQEAAAAVQAFDMTQTVARYEQLFDSLLQKYS
jgi:glycosyltransferase involved in cell wall biosynthesis